MPDFDLRVHHLDQKGQVSRAEPYRLVVDNGQHQYERPVGSGYWYASNGDLIRQPEVSNADKGDGTDETLAAMQQEHGGKAMKHDTKADLNPRTDRPEPARHAEHHKRK